MTKTKDEVVYELMRFQDGSFSVWRITNGRYEEFANGVWNTDLHRRGYNHDYPIAKSRSVYRKVESLPDEVLYLLGKYDSVKEARDRKSASTILHLFVGALAVAMAAVVTFVYIQLGGS